VSFSPDGRLLASAGMDTSGLVWDLTGRFRDGRFEPCPLPERDLGRHWNDLAGADAARAYRAVLALAGSPDNAVSFLHERLKSLTRPVDPNRVAALVADLDSGEFDRREKAIGELERLGPAAESPLRQALAGKPSLETRRRIERVLEKLAQTDLLRAGRAIEALEMIGTDPARRALEDVAGRAKGTGQAQHAAAAALRLAKLRPTSER
jgi:hypothetical protein